MSSSRDGQREDPLAWAELCALLGDGDAAAGARRLEAWLALGWLPAVPPGVRTGHALWRPEAGWTRRPGAVDAEGLLGHFRGVWALGGVFARETAVSVVDLDNRAGKAGGGGIDDDLSARVAVVRAAFPRAVWMRSSASGGLHAWTFLDEAHPLRVVQHLAHARVLAVAERIAPAVAARLHVAGVAGVPGFLEVLPQPFEQGGVIRVPLGPGSTLLDADMRPVALSAGLVVARLATLVESSRLSLHEAFSRVVPAVACWPVVAPVPPAPRVGVGREAPVDRVGGSPQQGAVAGRPGGRDWLELLRACDGRLPAVARASRSDCWRLVQRLWTHGLPGPSTRHAATFLLALASRWERLDAAAAEARLVAWFRRMGWRESAEWRSDARAAERKTRSIVRHVYRPDAPASRRPRPRHHPPCAISLGEQWRLEQIFPADPLAVEVGMRVLGWARANAYVLGRDRVVCEIPMRALGITTRRRRAAWQRVHDACVVFRLYGARVPLRRPDHRLGPQRARAARYTIVWEYADCGRPVRGRRAMTARRAGYLAARLRDSQRSASTVRRAVPLAPRGDAAASPCTPGALVRPLSLPLSGEAGVSAACGRCACGRVRWRPHASRCGKRAAFSKGLWADDPRGPLRRSVHGPVSGGSVHGPPTLASKSERAVFVSLAQCHCLHQAAARTRPLFSANPRRPFANLRTSLNLLDRGTGGRSDALICVLKEQLQCRKGWARCGTFLGEVLNGRGTLV